MKCIWHGTASIELIHSSGRLLFDPFVPLKGSNIPVKIEDYDGFSHILITHGHFDHIVNVPTIVKRNPSVIVYCTKTPYKTLVKKGVPKQNLQLIHYGDVLKIYDYTIYVYHGKHAILPSISSERIKYALHSETRSNLWFILKENSICKENDEIVFYHIECDHKSVSIMGSLNTRKTIEYPDYADVLILPYNGWEDNFIPAYKVIQKLKPKRILLDHYDDSFPPLTRPLDLSMICSFENVQPLEWNQEVHI